MSIFSTPPTFENHRDQERERVFPAVDQETSIMHNLNAQPKCDGVKPVSIIIICN